MKTEQEIIDELWDISTNRKYDWFGSMFRQVIRQARAQGREDGLREAAKIASSAKRNGKWHDVTLTQSGCELISQAILSAIPTTSTEK